MRPSFTTPVREWIACLPDFVRLLSRHVRAEALMRAHERTVAAYVTKLSSVDPRTLRDDQLWAELIDWQRTGTEWVEIVLLFGGVLIFETALRTICGKAGVPFEQVLYSHLAAGEKSVSAQQAFDLVALAREHPCLLIDDAGFAEASDHRAGLRVQLDEAIAGRHVDDAVVASAVGPERDAAA